MEAATTSDLRNMIQPISGVIWVESASCMDCIEQDKRVGEGSVPGNAKEDVKDLD